jgi:beta-galactosidase
MMGKGRLGQTLNRLAFFLLAPLLLTASSCRSPERAGVGVAEEPSAQQPAPAGPAVPVFEHSPASSAARRGAGLTYSADTLYFDGEPFYLWSGELPYYRFSPELWGPRLDAARDAGVLFITAYVPWNLHEYAEGRFDFTGSSGDGRRNLVGFIEQISRRGMYFIPKPGPFICAEVRHGGIPDWLTARHPEVAMRDERDRVVRFRQDGTPLPDQLNRTYVEYVRRWYTRLYQEVIAGRQYGRGPIVALQVENELLYSTSALANPFSWGYTEAVQGLYRDWLRSSYQDIGRYNREHGTRYEGFSAASAPKSRDWHFSSPAQWLAFQDWVRFKEWYGAAVLKEYAGILTGLGVKVPLYHNAGMLEDQAPMAFAPLAQELWLGVNFWLPRHPLNSFSSYVQGVRRLKQLKGSQPDRPSIVPELNWGWGTPGEFDFLARYTMPFSRGSNVYVLADSLHAGRFEGRPYSTIRQPYPGDAPIDSRGNPRPSYWLLARLIGFTRSEGAGLAEALPPASIALGSYLPYNAPALYTEFSRVRQSELAKVYSSAIAANAFLQQFMEGFISRDAEYRIVDLQRSGSRELAASGLLIVLSQEVMDAATQALLVWYVLQGGTLVLLPTVPSLDLELQPATVLRDALLPGLSWRQEKPARGSERLYFEGYEGPVQGRPPTQVLSGLPAGSRVLGRTGSGEPVALEKAAGRGRLILLAAYASDPDFYLWLAAREGYVARWAWSDDPQVEVVPLVNRQRGDSYLFVVNRGRSGRRVQVSYLQNDGRGTPQVLSTSIAAGSVSILAVHGSELRSASLNGGSGAFLLGSGTGLSLDRADQADLLRAGRGELLFRADRATTVSLQLPPGRGSAAVEVLSGSGQRVAATFGQGGLSFAYSPAEGAAGYYRIILPAAARRISLPPAAVVK